MRTIFIVSLMFVASCQHMSAKDEEYNVRGRWAWSKEESRCVKNWHRIYVDDKQNIMMFESSIPFKQRTGEETRYYKYLILDHGKNKYHVSLEDENRLDNEGDPVTWFLILIDPDTYYWRRSDWEENQGTSFVRRCR